MNITTESVGSINETLRSELKDNLSSASAVHAAPTPSAQSWFACGERVGYNPRDSAIVTAQDASLNVFFRREGDVTYAVTFLPGFPDGSFGWAKVLRRKEGK